MSLAYRLSRSLAAAALLGILMATAFPGLAQTLPTGPARPGGIEQLAQPGAQPGAPVRLRQASDESSAAQPAMPAAATTAPAPRPGTRPGEFESFVGLPRFGTDLIEALSTAAPDYSPEVPPDYLIQVGDELGVVIWGSVDADLRLVVDRTGRVTIPRVGTVMVAGLRFADLETTLKRRVGQIFKGFELSASLGRLRGVRVFVTGFAYRPGAYTVPALSTVMSAVMRAGGPAMAGSFRHIELRRGGKPVATFDLYDLVLRGDRSADQVVQPDDVIHVHAVGTLVAVRGSVNRPSVYEMKSGENLADLLRMSGGFTAVADRTRIALQRLEDRNSNRTSQLALPKDESAPLAGGDVFQVFSAVDATLSIERQNRRVKIGGEVARPGEYLLPPGSTLNDAIRMAGGLTSSAFLYGAQFNRESVRLTQSENYDRALRDFETTLIRNQATRRISTADEANSQSAQSRATAQLLDKLRALQPTGRVVLQMPLEASAIPELLVEDQDTLLVPAKPNSIGIFGSVFNAGNYLFSPGRELGDYLRLAGGPTRGADEGSVFVVRANGQVVSSRQSGGFFARGNRIESLIIQPGDTIFVPEEMDKASVLQTARDWTLLLFQLGVGAAGIKSALSF